MPPSMQYTTSSQLSYRLQQDDVVTNKRLLKIVPAELQAAA